MQVWMKELSTAVEGKQTLRTLTLTDCLSAIGIIQHKDFDVHILERNYKEKLKAIQLDQISEDEKIVRRLLINWTTPFADFILYCRVEQQL
jgi:hypothetical protein